MTTHFHVVEVPHDDGERLPILLDELRNPIVWANEYVIKARRSSLAPKTLIKELYVLGYLYVFCQIATIKLIERLKSGNGLTVDELTVQLFNWMRKNFGAQTRKVVKLVVDRETVDYRMGVVWRFIEWHMNAAMLRLANGDERINHIQAKIKALEKAIKTIQTDISKHNQKKLALSLQQINRLLDVCYPGHPENPWKTRYQERNYLILVLLLTFGFRRGELLKIKLRDCLTHGLIPEIRVVRRPDDKDDTRPSSPAVKTEVRTLPCDKFLARRLQDYITNERRNIPGAGETPFLILARTGQPMSEKRINGIFSQIVSKHPEFYGLSPHLCRHTCTTRLKTIAQAKGIEDAETVKYLKYFNGWRTDNSETYAEANIRKGAQDLSLTYQQGMFVHFTDIPQ